MDIIKIQKSSFAGFTHVRDLVLMFGFLRLQKIWYGIFNCAHVKRLIEISNRNPFSKRGDSSQPDEIRELGGRVSESDKPNLEGQTNTVNVRHLAQVFHGARCTSGKPTRNLNNGKLGPIMKAHSSGHDKIEISLTIEL